MWSMSSSQVVLTGITNKNDSEQGAQSSSRADSVSRTSSSEDSVEVEELEVPQVVVNRDVAKWVEPLGSGRPEFNNETEMKVSVIGTGDFGRALAAKLVQAGFLVKIGSRDPERNREFVERTTGGYLTTIPESVHDSDVIIVAVAKDFYPDLPLNLFSGKVLVDVSNRSTVHRKTEISQAEYLQGLVPRAAVVKAFNVLSAYVLENGGLQGSKEVFYAGDVHSAKQTVETLIRSLGFIPVDRGSLRSSREIEDIPVQRFPKWKAPFIISVILYLIFFLVAWGKFQICWTLTWDGKWHWGRWNTIPVTTVNSALSCHALTLLSLCYLPGVLAAYIQIFRGTKFSRFPNWLDQWLRMRKQLGLLMLLSAAIHAFISMAVLSPKSHELAYGDPPVINVTGQEVKLFGNAVMEWRGQCFLTAGAVAFVLAIILGITSLPSVSASLSWKEFAFIQSNLGWICLLFSCAHNLFYGWPYINGPSCGIPSSFQYVMYIPGLTILLKIPLVLPCISCYLEKIRGGWESKRVHRKITPSPVSLDSKETTNVNFSSQNHVMKNGRIINIRST